MYETDPGIPGHTVYRPSNLAAVADDMPIVVWGNGACSANGTWFQEFLTPLSAHGVLIVASGTPNGSGSTTSSMLIDAIDWAVAENSRAGQQVLRAPRHRRHLGHGAVVRRPRGDRRQP